MNKLNKTFRLVDLIKDLNVTIKGDENCFISGISPIQQSHPGHITFLTNSLYRKYLATTKASAVVLHENDADACSINAVLSKNPHYIYAKIAAFFAEQPRLSQGIHPSAVIGSGCQIDSTVAIGPHCIIGNHVKLAANVIIGPGCVIGDFVDIGEATCLDANVSIYCQVKIGKRTHIASGAVIGSDGFGFANEKGIWYKVPQLGTVEIGNDVSIGANTAIDRGAIENTCIEDGVKLDNLIQIGHNVRIGKNTIIAGCVGIAGSVIIGKNCMIGGATMITGHITIADNVLITGGTGVSKSIHEPGIYSSGIVGVVTNQEFRKNNARFHRLDHLMQRVKTLELTIKEMTERK